MRPRPTPRRLPILLASVSLGLVPTWTVSPPAGASERSTARSTTRADVPDSAVLSTPVLARGRMLDAAGHPAAGVARLYAWPAWSASDPTERTELPLLASSTAGPGGEFTLRAPSEAGAASLAGAGDGDTVNMVLLATSGEMRYEQHLAGRAQAAIRAAGAERGEAQAPLEVRFDPASGSVDRRPAGSVRPAGWFSNCYRKELARYPGQETMVGELGTTKGVNATFSYVSRADSTLSVAVKLGDRWGTRGERKVSNQQTARYVQQVRYPESHQIDSYFTYVRWEVACDGEGFATSEELAAESWDGGGTLVPKHVPSCLGSKYARAQAPDSDFGRDRNRAVSWKGAAFVAGAEFSASSGYSNYVSATWHFDKSEPGFTICGDNDVPTTSSRVFVGLDQPPRPCPKVGACPVAAAVVEQ